MRKINRPPCPNPTALATRYNHPDNKPLLGAASFGKCMYCEEKILSSQFGDIEHIKPKSRFPKLEFEWNNLGLVCSKCNNAKSNKYDEETPFIDPYTEDPEDYILAAGTFLVNKRGSERGELTISEITLNRPDLVEKRHEKIQRIGKTIDSCFRTKNETLKNNALEELKKEATEDKEYSLCVKYLLKSHEIL
ncbi:MAG: HNH endonuclease [Candidatus Moraniibacteriota bacterium]